MCYQTNIGFLETLHMNTIYELNIGFYLYLYFAKKLTTLEKLPHPEIYYPIEKQNYTHVLELDVTTKYYLLFRI